MLKREVWLVPIGMWILCISYALLAYYADAEGVRHAAALAIGFALLPALVLGALSARRCGTAGCWAALLLTVVVDQPENDRLLPACTSSSWR